MFESVLMAMMYKLHWLPLDYTECITLQKVVVLVDGMRTQLIQIQETVLKVLKKVSDAAVKSSVESDVANLKDKLEK